jgi:hypothetical protein
MRLVDDDGISFGHQVEIFKCSNGQHRMVGDHNVGFPGCFARQFRETLVCEWTL